MPVTSILWTEDRTADPDRSRRTATGHLGVRPVELPGGRTPSLAQRRRLAELLAGVAV